MKLSIQKNYIFMIFTFTLLITSSFVFSASSATIVNEDNQKLDPNALNDLVIATRHDSTIYLKYAEYFAQSALGASVGITSANQISFVAPTTYAAFETALTNPAIGASVAWGGGPTLFNNLVAADHLRSINDTSLLNWISANVSDTIAGAEMKKYDESNNLKWVAAAISSFGFTVNNNTLQSRNLPFPTTWEDLASPEFFTTAAQNNIAMGNAPDTTSNTRIYQIILQKFGWERGWEIIYSMAGNSQIYGGSVETRAAVERGDVAVSMTIDFYGVIAMNENPDCQYVIPEGSSIVNGDPIAISKNAPNLDAARAFTKFVLSAEGQALWLDNRINRLPVRSDAFDAARSLVGEDTYIVESQVDLVENLYTKTLENEGITFDEDLSLSLEEAMRYHFEATITNVHTTLRDSWSEIALNYQGGAFDPAPDQRLDQLLDIYGVPAINLTKAQEINQQMISDSTFRQEQQSAWESYSIDKYNEAKEAVDDPFTYTTETVETTETTITTTDSQGNTVTTTSEVEVTSQVTEQTSVSAVESSVEDVPFNLSWLLIGLATPLLLNKLNIKKKVDIF